MPAEIAKLAPADLARTKALIGEYLRWIGEDLSFQNVEEELASFPGPYAEPEGSFFVAREGVKIVGCVGMKKLGPGLCEMKRLFVRDDHRGMGLGSALVVTILEEAKRKGYERMRLDSLRKMESAVALYRRLGFREIGQYVENPLPGAMFMEKAI
jgi:putative acetyltransferase